MYAKSNSKKGLIIGGLVVGALGFAGIKHYITGKKCSDGSNSGHKSQSKHSAHKDSEKGGSAPTIRPEDIDLSAEAMKMFDELRTEANKSYDKLKSETEIRTKEFAHKLEDKAMAYRTSAKDRAKQLAKEAQQQFDSFKHKSDDTIKNFQKSVEDKAMDVEKRAHEAKDWTKQEFEKLKHESEDKVIVWTKEAKEFVDKKVSEAKRFVDHNFPDKKSK